MNLFRDRAEYADLVMALYRSVLYADRMGCRNKDANVAMLFRRSIAPTHVEYLLDGCRLIAYRENAHFRRD